MKTTTLHKLEAGEKYYPGQQELVVSVREVWGEAALLGKTLSEGLADCLCNCSPHHENHGIAENGTLGLEISEDGGDFPPVSQDFKELSKRITHIAVVDNVLPWYVDKLGYVHDFFVDCFLNPSVTESLRFTNMNIGTSCDVFVDALVVKAVDENLRLREVREQKRLRSTMRPHGIHNGGMGSEARSRRRSEESNLDSQFSHSNAPCTGSENIDCVSSAANDIDCVSSTANNNDCVSGTANNISNNIDCMKKISTTASETSSSNSQQSSTTASSFNSQQGSGNVDRSNVEQKRRVQIDPKLQASFDHIQRSELLKRPWRFGHPDGHGHFASQSESDSKLQTSSQTKRSSSSIDWHKTQASVDSCHKASASSQCASSSSHSQNSQKSSEKSSSCSAGDSHSQNIQSSHSQQSHRAQSKSSASKQSDSSSTNPNRSHDSHGTTSGSGYTNPNRSNQQHSHSAATSRTRTPSRSETRAKTPSRSTKSKTRSTRTREPHKLTLTIEQDHNLGPEGVAKILQTLPHFESCPIGSLIFVDVGLKLFQANSDSAKNSDSSIQKSALDPSGKLQTAFRTLSEHANLNSNLEGVKITIGCSGDHVFNVENLKALCGVAGFQPRNCYCPRWRMSGELLNQEKGYRYFTFQLVAVDIVVESAAESNVSDSCAEYTEPLDGDYEPLSDAELD